MARFVRRRVGFAAVVLLSLGIAACSGGSSADDDAAPSPNTSAEPKAGDHITPTDYADPEHWIAWPQSPTQPSDVFFLYPSAYHPTAEGSPMISPVDDPGMREQALGHLTAFASAFEGAGNLYAPLYRQTDLAQVLPLPDDEQTAYVGGAPTTDAVAAFEKFLDETDGRPYTIVAHSQGSQVAKNLVYDYLPDHPDALDRLVAVYAIGYAVTQDELDAHPAVPFAQGADDTGVLISYNTEAPGVAQESEVWRPGSVAINPISWTRTDEAAPASANLGSRRLDDDGGLTRVEHLADARVDVDKGVVTVSTVDPDEYSATGDMLTLFPRGTYHSYDVLFFYDNLGANAAQRVAAWLAAHAG